MADETRSPEDVLEQQIQEARTSTINKIYKPASDPTDGTGEGREDKRLKIKYLNELDGLVQKFMEARAIMDDPDGEEADAKLVYFNNIWQKTCQNSAKKRRIRFSLRVDAFMDRVTNMLDVEKEQIKAAKEAYQADLFERWYRRNLIDMKWRQRRYRIAVFFWPWDKKKKTVKELFRAYWDSLEKLEHKPPTFTV